MSEPSREAVEQAAAEVHEVYLATARTLGWPIKPALDVPYGQLAEDAQELDRAFVRWHFAKVEALEREREAFIAGSRGGVKGAMGVPSEPGRLRVRVNGCGCVIWQVVTQDRADPHFYRWEYEIEYCTAHAKVELVK